MAEYKGIKGFKVQYLDQDPVPAVAGWSAGNNMNSGRANLAGSGSAGTQTAALAFGGNAFPGPTTSAFTEEYNGSNWTAVNAMNTGRQYVGGFGTISASVAFGGEPPTTATEEYNGTNWTTVNSMSVSRGQAAGAGIETAGLAISGEGSAPSLTNATEEYDGTNWTTGGTVATARRVNISIRVSNSSFSFWWCCYSRYYGSNRRI
jgi:hypothetical protein